MSHCRHERSHIVVERRLPGFMSQACRWHLPCISNKMDMFQVSSSVVIQWAKEAKNQQPKANARENNATDQVFNRPILIRASGADYGQVGGCLLGAFSYHAAPWLSATRG